MKRNDSNLIEKLFGASFGKKGLIPLKSNIVRNGNPGKHGFNPIGHSSSSPFSNADRKSPLLGNYSSSNLMSSYLDKIGELRGYQLLDISKLATNFFSDYIINFLADEGNGTQVVTVLNEDGSTDEQKTQRINDILTKDIRIFDYLRDHVQDYVFYGDYYSMLKSYKDEQGHTRFRVEELYDPIAVIVKKKRSKDGDMEEVFLARGDDNCMYEIPQNEIIYIASNNLRLVNDLREDWKEKEKQFREKPKEGKKENREKVVQRESYTASEPLFYPLILKVKELAVKELLVSLISLRDLSSIQIFLLQVDKSVPLEAANELCARATKLANNTNELSSFLTSQFDVVSFIENTLTQPAKFIPDYNSTLGGKNALLPLDKLSDKLLDIMQSVETCKNNVLGPLGLPSTILDSTSGSKWQVLQQSERANSRVATYMSGIKDSVTNLVCTLYRVLYNEEIDPSQIKLHISEKTSVEYNNQINQSESINSLVQGVSGIVVNALQTLDTAAPFINPKAFLEYIQNLLKDIDPNTEALVDDTSIQNYLAVLKSKMQMQFEQQGMDSSIVEQIFNPVTEEQKNQPGL